LTLPGEAKAGFHSPEPRTADVYPLPECVCFWSWLKSRAKRVTVMSAEMNQLGLVGLPPRIANWTGEDLKKWCKFHCPHVR
jgi:hypothetical protein